MDWWSTSVQLVQKRASEAAEQARVLAHQASVKAVQVAGQATEQVKVATEQVKVLAHATAEEAQARLQELHLKQPREPKQVEPSEDELSAYGLNAELIGFLQSLTYSTFSDFPVHTLSPDGEAHPSYKLNAWQEKHALLSLQTVEQLHNLRFVLCPRRMDEDTFWIIYFALTKRYLPAEVLDAPPAAAEAGSSKDKGAGAKAGPSHDDGHDADGDDEDDDDAQLVELENDPELAAYLTEALAESHGGSTADLGSEVDDLDDYISKLDDEVDQKPK